MSSHFKPVNNYNMDDSLNILYVVSRPLQINTSASIRNKATITGFIENGHKVDLITTAPDSNHLAFDVSMEMAQLNCKYIELQGIQSVARIGRRLKFLRPFYSSVIKLFQRNSIYDNLSDIVKHTGEVDLKAKKYDFIISSSDPKSSHLFVEKLLLEQGKYFQGKWVQIWGDPFYDDITLLKNVNRNDVYNEENRLLGGADKVVYVSKLTLLKQQDRYVSNALKMEFHPIPYNREIVTANRNLRDLDVVNLAYCGDYASNVRNIVPLYNAIKDCKKANLVIYGNSDITLNNTENITLKRRQSYEKVDELESKSDILVHLSNLRGSQIPGKIFQYSGTSKPILFILDGDSALLRSEFEKYNRYYFAFNNSDSITKTIEQIVADNRSFDPVEDFSKKIIARAILYFM